MVVWLVGKSSVEEGDESASYSPAIKDVPVSPAILNRPLTSQTWMVSSLEPETMYLPSDEKATEETSAVCPTSGSPIVCPLRASQS